MKSISLDGNIGTEIILIKNENNIYIYTFI